MCAMRFRTLASLLDAQPRGLTKYPDHRLLWDHFLSSEKLQRLRISSRCWRLLNKAAVPPENLTKFYRAYRLPDDPFFPLFLSVKSRWLEDRERWKSEREDYILKQVKNLPEDRRKSLRILAELEEARHPAGGRPLWEKRIYPGTKKRAGELVRLREAGWQQLWREHLEALTGRYPGMGWPDLGGDPCFSSHVLARLMLHNPQESRYEVNKSYRQLSRDHHPDKGGDPEAFRNIKAARDYLMKETSDRK